MFHRLTSPATWNIPEICDREPRTTSFVSSLHSALISWHLSFYFEQERCCRYGNLLYCIRSQTSLEKHGASVCKERYVCLRTSLDHHRYRLSNDDVAWNFSLKVDYVNLLDRTAHSYGEYRTKPAFILLNHRRHPRLSRGEHLQAEHEQRKGLSIDVGESFMSYVVITRDYCDGW